MQGNSLGGQCDVVEYGRDDLNPDPRVAHQLSAVFSGRLAHRDKPVENLRWFRPDIHRFWSPVFALVGCEGLIDCTMGFAEALPSI
jgi:hypothetical protein